jgi:hypothetical protein
VRSTCIVLLIVMASVVATAESAPPSPGSAAEPLLPEATLNPADPTRGKVFGTVVETMDAGRYTYVQIDTGEERLWAAGPHTEIAVGDPVSVAGGTLMVDFFSKSLDRTFDRLYLVGAIGVPSGEKAAPAGHTAGTAPAAETVDTKGIERPEGGRTVAEILEDRAGLVGQQVVLRGKVVKINMQILGRNWIHVQDGTTGPGGADKVIVTTDGIAEVGNTVLVRGTIVTDKDFGYGYKYDVLVENASVTVE